MWHHDNENYFFKVIIIRSVESQIITGISKVVNSAIANPRKNFGEILWSNST